MNNTYKRAWALSPAVRRRFPGLNLLRTRGVTSSSQQGQGVARQLVGPSQSGGQSDEASWHGRSSGGGRSEGKRRLLTAVGLAGGALLAGAAGAATSELFREYKSQSSYENAHGGALHLQQLALQKGPPAPKADMLKALPELLPPGPRHPKDEEKDKAPGGGPLTRDAIADAAALAAPAVVHLTVSIGRGMFVGQSEGSGAIIRSDGIVLTNAHVVADATEGDRYRGRLQVTMSDGRTFDGQVLSYDTLADIAVVKIESSTPLPTIRLGSSRHLRPGDWVLALGSPLHLSNTVTHGIISCTERKSTELGLRGARGDYIQTDAAINQGNSGGPLVNLDGEVVGINCLKALTADGVGFAIPIDTAIKVVEQLAKHGRVVRPFVGMKMLELNPAILSQLKERDPAFPSIEAGILVPKVIPGSPADRAGMLPGDVIVAFGGEKVSTTRQIIEKLGDKVGTEFEVEVRRPHGKMATLKVITEEASPDW